VPFGLFSAAIVWFFLKNQESEIVRHPIDWIGLFLLAVGVGCIQIMLDNGKDLDWFESNVIISLTIVSIVALFYFSIWNRYQDYRVVDFSFFKNKNFLFGTLSITIGFLVYFASTVTTPLWLQTEQVFTPYWAGIAVAPIGIAPFFIAPWIGKHMQRFDLRVLAAVSFLLFSIGFFYQSNFTTQVTIEMVMLARLMQGFGIALFLLPLLQLSLGEIPKERYASAAGLFNFIRILVGSGFGTSLSIQLWDRLEIFHHARLTESSTVYRQTTTQFYTYLENLGTKFTQEVNNAILDSHIEQQAFMLATNDIIWLGAWLYLLLIPLVFFCKKVQVTKSQEAIH
jgi:DHA2 family multidrug resistance protein